jgi:diketogulonate reductase-like aldo/keto reductase
MLSKTFKLRGLEIPMIGIGTNSLRGTVCQQTLNYAFSLGYRHVDASPSYLNQHMVALALARVPRSSFFITSKLATGLYSKEKAWKLVNRTLEDLRIKHLDLCLVEWPGGKGLGESEGFEENRKIMWESLIEMQRKGLTKHIGVCNFQQKHIEGIWKKTGVVPEVNQVEMHPLCFDKALVEYCNRKSIQLIAHTPLARKHKELWDNITVKLIATKHKVTVAQILLNWLIQKGIAVIPRSQNYENIRNNSMLDFQLTAEDILYLDSLNKNLHISADPSRVQ